MNIMSLIHQHPLLFADLKNLGLSHDELQTLAHTVTLQLGGETDHNLCYVLAALNCSEFIRLADTGEIAQSAKIAPSLAQSAILTIAPWIDRFQLRAI